MKVASVMTKAVHTCRPDQDLNCAARIMWEADCGFVPVLDATGRVAGVVTDRDVCMAAYTRGLPLASVRVNEVMAKSVVTCSPEDDLAGVHSLMRRWRVRRLPVVDTSGKLAGILSLNDLARAADLVQPPNDRELACGQVASTMTFVGKHRSACDLPPAAAKKPVDESRAVAALAARQADVEC
jgi:CBS domain-containing protein